MRSKFILVVGGLVVGGAMLSLPLLMPPAMSAEDATQKPVMINRFFTGPDGQTHVEEIEAKFAPSGGLPGYKLLANSGAELRRAVSLPRARPAEERQLLRHRLDRQFEIVGNLEHHSLIKASMTDRASSVTSRRKCAGKTSRTFSMYGAPRRPARQLAIAAAAASMLLSGICSGPCARKASYRSRPPSC